MGVGGDDPGGDDPGGDDPPDAGDTDAGDKDEVVRGDDENTPLSLSSARLARQDDVSTLNSRRRDACWRM